MEPKHVRVVGPHGCSEHALGDAGLTLGGISADVTLVHDSPTPPLGRLRQLGDAICLEPDPRGTPLLINDRQLERPAPLRPGDVLRTGNHEIEVQARASGIQLVIRDPDEDTLPPEYPSAAFPVPAGEAAAVIPPPTTGHTRQAQPRDSSVVTPVRFEPAASSAEPRLAQRPVRPFPTASIALAALGLALVSSVWFAFTSVAVQILIEPQPDRLALGGSWFTPHLGNRFLVRPGSYEVRAERQGFEPLSAAIVIDSRDDQRFAFALTRKPGHLNLRAEPEGARAFLDGVQVGTLPLRNLAVESGRHRVRLEAPRHLALERDIVIEGGDITQDIELRLLPDWAPVTVETIPSGARISVDGEARGETPATVEVEAGARRLTLSLGGRKTVERELVVVANEPQTIGPLRLAEADGQLSIVSVPGDAILEIDGEYKGRTPLEVSLSPGGEHRIRLSKRGYRTAMRLIEVDGAGSDRVRIELEAALGKIEFRTTPADAELYVDGRSRGAANQTLRLAATEHEVELRKEGFQTKSFPVTPRAGFLKIVETTLAREAIAAAAARPSAVPAGPPPVLKAAQGQELIRIEPGEFTMGSSRREQGRRSNEVRRNVKLTRAFYLSRQEITNQQFREFEAEHSSGQVSGQPLDGDDQPVVRVRWDDAVRFCNWLSARDGLVAAYIKNGKAWTLARPVSNGYRLPTEAEWVWAARYEASEAGRRYPWGDGLPPPPQSGNYADTSAQVVASNTLQSYSDGFPTTAPVGSFPANGLGLFDLGGNAAEWVHDIYSVRRSTRKQPLIDPAGPDEGRFHVIRGSSWKHFSVTQLRLAFRDYGDEKREDVGFRIARHADE